VQGASGHSWEAQKSSDQREVTMGECAPKTNQGRVRQGRIRIQERRSFVLEVAGKVE
jgi:hypothetical protein